jgi:hypothetical protein
LTFTTAINHRRIGSGWNSWSHGYTGDVYYSNSATSLTFTVPAGTTGVYFYVEPNPYETHTFTAVVNGTVESEPFEANGSAGAAGIAICGTPTSPLETITVSSDIDFSIGEFGIVCVDIPGACCDETTANCTDDVMGSACAFTRFVGSASCDELNPVCGSPGACCDAATAVCEDGVLIGACAGEATPDTLCADLVPACGECHDAEMVAPGTWTGTTVGAGDDCNLRAGADVTVKVTVPTAGNWKFDLCASSPSWDTYMFIGTDCCLSSWYNDDGCTTDGVLSTLSLAGLAAGDYYVDIEPYDATVSGPVTLTVGTYVQEARAAAPAQMAPTKLEQLSPVRE